MTLRPAVLVAMFTLVAPPAFAAPGPVTRLIAPSGEVAMGVPITFSWQSIPESTWYLLWLGKGTPTALVMEQWYSADQAGCAAGGTCTITVTAPVNAGAHVWFIQTWAAGVVGPWSPGLQFVVTAPHWSSVLPDSRRFTLVFDGQAVLDHETGLVWDRTPHEFGRVWAAQACPLRRIFNRQGWRDPTIAELSSLVDRTTGDGLPAGHPFVLGAAGVLFWSSTSYPADSTDAWLINLAGAAPGAARVEKDSLVRSWCVRGATGGSQ